MTTPIKPVFDIGETFPFGLHVGDHVLPILIRNMTKGELVAFKKEFDALFEPRGTMTEADLEARRQGRAMFAERAILENITLPEGVARYRGQWVTDGDGFINLFHSRWDVLSLTMYAIYNENHLGSVLRKNSVSPLASEPGSGPSMPASGGDRLGSTVAHVDGLTSASSAPVTGGLGSSEGEPSSSGATLTSDAARTH